MSIRKTDRKAQMMDAGTALFEAQEGIGMAIGHVRRKMEAYGEVANANETSADVVPDTTGDFDLFLDFSTPWRSRYISCKVEAAGEAGEAPGGEPLHRYAAVFKEGNRSTHLRAGAHVLLIAGLVGVALSGVAGWLGGVAAFFLAGFVAYRWIVPSAASQRTMQSLQRDISDP